ncbi:MAG: carboxypeptidase M32, partial [Chitinophagaceae bacterium]|nr:carboxypeptidase M32 [Rubrivivax sp.]
MSRLNYFIRLSEWDQRTCMPAGGALPKARAHAELASLQHQLDADPELDRLLQRVLDEPLDAWQHANVEEMRR